MGIFDGWISMHRGLMNAVDTLKEEAAEYRKQIQYLERWKAEAIAVEFPRQEIAAALDMKIGINIHDNVLPAILGMKSKISDQERIIKGLEELTERQWKRIKDDEWISVDERLPDNDQAVLSIDGNDIYEVATIWQMEDGERQWWRNDGDGRCNVTHWMPLPSAPVDHGTEKSQSKNEQP